MNIKLVARPVERPKSFGIVRVEFKERADKALRNLDGGKVHLAEGGSEFAIDSAQPKVRTL